VPRSSETKHTLRFIFILCFVCALLLSTLATVLRVPQEKAKQFDQNEQLLKAANIQTKDILATYAARIRPMLVDDKGNLVSFQQAGLDYSTYLQKHQKKGFADLPLKLIYEIEELSSKEVRDSPTAKGRQVPFRNWIDSSANSALKDRDCTRATVHTGDKVDGYVIPINGFGLWDAIYGYIGIKADGTTVLGATWYNQAETAGLGANIALPQWQKQFKNKQIFQVGTNGKTDYSRAALGLTVIKGRVSEILGNSPKALSSIDGISGATLTGKGVTDAYADCLAPYRPFLIKLGDAWINSPH